MEAVAVPKEKWIKGRHFILPFRIKLICKKTDAENVSECY
jgi:hypothetical protein